MKNGKTILMGCSAGAAALALIGLIFVSGGVPNRVVKATDSVISKTLVINAETFGEGVTTIPSTVSLNGGLWSFSGCTISGSKISMANGGSISSARAITKFDSVSVSSDLSKTISVVTYAENSDGTRDSSTSLSQYDLESGSDTSLQSDDFSGMDDSKLHYVVVSLSGSRVSATFTSLTFTYSCVAA
jgi:hypothetical protein